MPIRRGYGNRDANIFNGPRPFCRFCNKPHSQKQNCRVLCHYCHDMHPRDEMDEGMCPKMAHHARALQKETSYLCQECYGEGAFEKQVETTYRETKELFEARLAEWKEKEHEEGE